MTMSHPEDSGPQHPISLPVLCVTTMRKGTGTAPFPAAMPSFFTSSLSIRIIGWTCIFSQVTD